MHCASSFRRIPLTRANVIRSMSLATTLLSILILMTVGVTSPAWATNATTTTLVVKSAGSTVTTVTAGSVVTLTATVTLAGNPVTTGQVAFCDATATHCTDIHLLGTSQLTLTGAASLSFIPGAGARSYKAIFIPSGSHGGSVSSASALTVTRSTAYPTVTSFTSIDSLGNYQFNATVVGTGGLLAAPVGTVSFLDTSNNNAVLATGTLSASIPGISLPAPSTTEVGNTPVALATADFNGDGIPDVATVNVSANTVSIILGNGDGTFTAVNSSPATGASPESIVAADFNGDGKIDLAVGNHGDGTVTILLGDGNGTFTLAATPTVGTNPQFMAAGDFNEDGNQDLAVSNYVSGDVTILLGNGNGAFTAGADLTGLTNPVQVAAGDFNNDGHLDLVVGEWDTNQVQILLGDGSGNFTAGAAPTAGDAPEFVAVGDFNGDGNLDLAVQNYWDATTSILLGDGTGNFTLDWTSFSVEDATSAILVADFNQDGFADIATTVWDSSGAAVVWLGAGDGTVYSYTYSSGSFLNALVAADFNGDGVPDLAGVDVYDNLVETYPTVLSQTANAAAISVTPTGIGVHNVEASYPGSTTTAASLSGTAAVQGVAATTTTLVVSSGGKAVSSVAAGGVVTLTASVSGLALQPGIKAMAVQSAVHPNEVPQTATIGQVSFCDATASDCLGIHLLGTAQVTSDATASMSFVPGIGSHSYKAVFLVDYYGAASVSSVQPLTVTGGYPTTTTIASSGAAGNYTLTASVTGESNLNVPVGGTISFLDSSNGSALLGTATLSHVSSNLLFQAAITPATGEYPERVVTADFNGDGLADALVVNVEDETLTVLLGKGDGTFTSAPVVYLAGISAVVGDFNNDGKPDVAVATYGNAVQILLGNGDGTFTAAGTAATGVNPYEIATGDFNGDGYADVVVSNHEDNTVTILLGQGDGTLTAGSTPSTGANPDGLKVADFNGDHRADIAVVNETDGTVTILVGNGDGTFGTSATVPVGSTPYLEAAGDFNGDGKVDLAVANYDDSTVTILLGNGDGTFTTNGTVATGNNPYAIAIADFNGDGKTDLAVDNYTDGTVSILLGNGDGTFTASTALPGTGAGPYDLVVADLNGDGLPDMMVPNYDIDTMSVLLTQLQEGAQATLTHVSPLGTGTHNVLASYPLTTPYASSQSTTTPLVAGIGASSLSLTANPASSSSFGDQVVLTATLSPAAPEGVSTNGETVTFYNGKTSLGTGTLASGVATLTVSSLPIGADSLTASYAGDANQGGGTSSAIAFTVSNNALTLTLTGGTATTTIVSNGTATYAFMVTPGSSGTFGANVTFAVTGGPAGMTATFNPASIAAGTRPTTVTLTVTAGAQAAVRRQVDSPTRMLSPLALGMLLLPFAGRLRRSRKQIAGWVCLVLLLLGGVGAVTGLSGCGSSTPAVTAPAAQNYTMTVTATSGSVSKSTTLTLTVN
jgi:hypothetical protein